MPREDEVSTEAEVQKPKLDISKLKRKKKEQTEADDESPPMLVSSAAIEKALDLAFAPSREMLPSVTVIDKYQGRLFPLIDVINIIWEDVLQVATYRQDKDEYKRAYKRSQPAQRNWLDELLHRTALWQKSIGGTNLSKIAEIALAEKEAQGPEGDYMGSHDAWGKD